MKDYFVSNAIKTDVTAVKLVNDTCLVGVGNYLHIYDNESSKQLKKTHIFEEQLFGIELNANASKVLVFGGDKLKVFSYNDQTLELIELQSCKCNDWILTARFVDNDANIATVFMHNVVTLWNINLQEIKSVVCEERCILYSAYIANDTWENVIVLSGTVFSQILIWWPSNNNEDFCPVLCRLEGHKGVIFSLDYSLKLGLICSTSDDRTTSLWSIKNRDLLTELKKSPVTISLKSTLYGHSARVFRCKLLDNYILTAGEDSIVNVWNIEGSLIRRIDGHQGGPIWTLDCREDTNIIVTGGGDCGVTIFNLNLFITKEQLKIENSTPKKLLIFPNNNLLTITEDGTLIYYNSLKRQFLEISKHTDLKSYALLEKSPCGTSVALAGYHGNVHIYKHTANDLLHVFSCQIKNEGRIFSAHWLSCKTILTCGRDGTLTMWVVKDRLIPVYFFQLPLTKERWTTAACLCGFNNILIGDRRGNLYLYSFESVNPVQTLKKAHNYLGITNLYFKNDEVISLGRNSIINKYTFDAKQGKLTPISSDKVPFTWLGALHQETNPPLLFAFSGTNLIIWDYKARRVLLDDYCGGGHRSWDLNVTNNEISFCYIKDKNVNLISCRRSNLQPTDVCEGYHIKEINALKGLKLSNSPLKFLLISGGEDTTLRLSSINFDDDLNNLQNLNVLKSHLSSIRAITTVKIDETCENNENRASHLVFSAGGRAQIILWELLVVYSNNSIVKIVCSERHSYYEPLSKDDSETRIMDLCSLRSLDSLILFAACSNGSIKTFVVDLDNEPKQLSILTNFNYKLKCILKVTCLEVNNFKVLITMATDGNIAFWNLNYLIENVNNRKLEEHIFKDFSLNPTSLIKAHKSGINSYCISKINETTALFLTGGDDNAISLNCIEFITSDELKINTFATYTNEALHCAQITGTLIHKNYFITSSIDQRILLFKWCLSGNKLNAEYLGGYNTTICDAQGLECLDVEGNVKIVIYGRGIEILSVKPDYIS